MHKPLSGLLGINSHGKKVASTFIAKKIKSEKKAETFKKRCSVCRNTCSIESNTYYLIANEINTGN